MRDTIVVHNKVQKVLLKKELQGQISDGQWENAMPSTHWKRPCTADVVIRPDLPLGHTGQAFDRRYDFLHPGMLRVIKTHMIVYARLTLIGVEEADIDAIEYMFDCFDENSVALESPEFELPTWIADSVSISERYAEMANTIARFIQQYGDQVEMLKLLTSEISDSSLYGMKDLKKDLEALKTSVNRAYPSILVDESILDNVAV